MARAVFDWAFRPRQLSGVPSPEDDMKQAVPLRVE
jgi:hypothetical protein